jgi:antibiotic biosynthesis monooxygenase (ABM) superfamily enzyme
MLLQIYFEVEADRTSEFEQMYQADYLPAMQKQAGYEGSRLLRLFPPAVVTEMKAQETPFNYQMELVFDTEENRRKWAASDDHQEVWPIAQGLAKRVAWRGYDVAGRDRLG